MTPHNPANERIKRQYVLFLKEAQRQSDSTVDSVAAALARFESDTKHRDFRYFNPEQARAFKRRLAEHTVKASGARLSKATLYSTLTQLKRFFQWLAMQPGYRSRLNYSDAEYFNLSANDSRIATARRERPIPTIEQILHVIACMPAETAIERRDRALIAFTLLTGARDSAIASTKLKHLDVIDGRFQQDAREVKTKFRKTFTTFLFPVGGDARRIVEEWVWYLRTEPLWGNDDPLFPATRTALNADHQFAASGLDRKHWNNAAPIRRIFAEAFKRAGLPYFNPHSFRNTLVRLGQAMCRSPEEFKAWSQNLGHEGVLTTFANYGTLGFDRQGEVLRNLSTRLEPAQGDTALLDTLQKLFLQRAQAPTT